MPHVEVSKGRGSAVLLYHEVHGEGPIKILCVTGFMTHCKYWMPQVNFFTKCGGFQVCIFDNRGFGYSSVPTSHYSTSDMALDAIELADHLGWGQFHLCGLSMGGMISMEIAWRITNRLQSLTLSVTHSGGMHGFAPFSGVFSLLKAAVNNDDSQRADIMNKVLYSKEYLQKAENGVKMSDKLRKNYVDQANALPKPTAAGFLGHTRACLTHFVSNERLSYIRESGLPILIMTGTYDHLVKPVNSHNLRKILKAEIEIFEGAGHIINVECEDKFNELLLKHIQKSMDPKEKPKVEEIEIEAI